MWGYALLAFAVTFSWARSSHDDDVDIGGNRVIVADQKRPQREQRPQREKRPNKSGTGGRHGGGGTKGDCKGQKGCQKHQTVQPPKPPTPAKPDAKRPQKIPDGKGYKGGWRGGAFDERVAAAFDGRGRK